MCKICLKRTLDATFLDCLALTFCDVIGELLPEWACLTLQGGTTFLFTSKLADIPVSRVRKSDPYVLRYASQATQKTNYNISNTHGHEFNNNIFKSKNLFGHCITKSNHDYRKKIITESITKTYLASDSNCY